MKTTCDIRIVEYDGERNTELAIDLRQWSDDGEILCEASKKVVYNPVANVGLVMDFVHMVYTDMVDDIVKACENMSNC